MKVLVEGFKFPYFISTNGIVSGGKYNRSKIKVNRRRIMSPSKLKYIIRDGYVKSQDGDVHYISHQQVVRLFRLNPLECLMENRPDWFRGYSPEFLETLKILSPRQNGDYSL